ncbi:MAG: D-amino-acid transaminase [Gammaproteobacteria bacterium]|jgi:D-alanine transaminase|nr:D-amino-acid transaminase [Gammaproteobacteria bacterium]
MSTRIVYLNGEFLPVDQAKISVMDRGFLFADSVYEVVPFLDRHLVGLEGHLNRLRRSLSGISLPYVFENSFFIDIFKTLLARNPDQGDNRTVYLQITRGVSDTRAHFFPSDSITPTIFVQTTAVDMPSFDVIKQGMVAVTAEDLRWEWCHIKSTSLLPNVLSTQKAKEAAAKEAILVRDGMITEGASSNVFVVKDGEILTPRLSIGILGGITREIVLDLAAQNNIPCRETEISEIALWDADEVWVTSATKEILPIVRINDHVVGDGCVGKVWLRMMDLYKAYKNALPLF